MKGEQSTLGLLVWTLVIMAAATVVGMIIFNVTKGTSKQYSEFEQENLRRACKAQGALGEPGIDYLDKDGDGLPDDCDFCLGGNDNQDDNKDGIADACEPRSAQGWKPGDMSLKQLCNNAPKCTSKDCYIEESQQCVLPTYA